VGGSLKNSNNFACAAGALKKVGNVVVCKEKSEIGELRKTLMSITSSGSSSF
jgi:hypothetical protein